MPQEEYIKVSDIWSLAVDISMVAGATPGSISLIGLGAAALCKLPRAHLHDVLMEVDGKSELLDQQRFRQTLAIINPCRTPHVVRPSSDDGDTEHCHAARALVKMQAHHFIGANRLSMLARELLRSFPKLYPKRRILKMFVRYWNRIMKVLSEVCLRPDCDNSADSYLREIARYRQVFYQVILPLHDINSRVIAFLYEAIMCREIPLNVSRLFPPLCDQVLGRMVISPLMEHNPLNDRISVDDLTAVPDILSYQFLNRSHIQLGKHELEAAALVPRRFIQAGLLSQEDPLMFYHLNDELDKRLKKYFGGPLKGIDEICRKCRHEDSFRDAEEL